MARLFVIKSADEHDDELIPGLVANSLRVAAGELAASGAVATHALAHARLSVSDARRVERRLERLVDDFRASEVAEGTPFALAAALYPHGRPDA